MSKYFVKDISYPIKKYIVNAENKKEFLIKFLQNVEKDDTLIDDIFDDLDNLDIQVEQLDEVQIID